MRTPLYIITIIALGLAGCSSSPESNSSTSQQASTQPQERTVFSFGDALPDYNFTTLNGDEIQMSDYEGKVLILNFWATWCGPCRREIPELVELQDELGKYGVEIIGISLDEEGFAAVEPFLASFDMNYTIVHDDYTYGNRLGGVYMLPTTYIIDREGKLAFRKIGEVTKEELLPELADMIEG
ncbi:MAG: TlpA family protein disulfide reductase [Balneolaceae bacterium]